MILILSLQHIRFSSFWPAVLQMACECLRRLLKPIKSMARFHTTVKCGLILYIYREREYQYITYYMWFLSRTFNYCWPPSGHPSTLVLRTCAMLFLAIPSLRQHLWALRKAESIGTHWLARSRKNCQWSAQFAWIWKLLDAACIFLTWPVLAVNIWTILECFFYYYYILLIFCSGRLMRTMSWKTIT